MLHWYGVYAFGWILLPPWMGIMDEDGVRTVSSLSCTSYLYFRIFIRGFRDLFFWRIFGMLTGLF